MNGPESGPAGRSSHDDADPYEHGDAAGAGGGREARDDERVFTTRPPAPGAGFATTRWGRAWLKALEDSALDGKQLRAGRGLARAGTVGAVSVRPGRVTSVVRDRDGTPWRADVLVRELDDLAWDRFLGLVAEQAGFVAALLARELPPALVRDAREAGVDLLPGVGELEPECACGEWDHCVHTSALAHQVGRVLDSDPLVLFLLRGRATSRLLAELQERSTRHCRAPDARAVAGVPADEVYATGAVLPPLPAAPVLPERAGEPPALDTATAPPGEVDPAALEFLASAAAAEAYALLADALSPGHAERPLGARPQPDEDAVRLAARRPASVYADRLAHGCDRDRAGLARAVRAWEFGGAPALSVLEKEWEPGPRESRRAASALESAWEEGEGPGLERLGNRWTADGRQVRLDREGSWWPYRLERGHWTPAGARCDDPATAYALAAGGEGDDEDTAAHRVV